MGGLGNNNEAVTVFRKKVLSSALASLNYLEKAEYSASEIADLVMSSLGLKQDQKQGVLSIITKNNEQLCFKEYIQNCLESGLGQKNSQENTLINRQTLKERIHAYVQDNQIVTTIAANKKFGKELASYGFSLKNFVNANFKQNEIHMSENFIASYPTKADEDSFVLSVLDKHGNRPIGIAELAKISGLDYEDAEAKIKRSSGFYHFVLWNSYQAWSLFKVKEIIKDEQRRKFAKLLDYQKESPIPMKDIFHIVFVGIIAENDYALIDENAKETFTRIAINILAPGKYEFCKDDKKYHLKLEKPQASDNPIKYPSLF